MKRFAPLLCAIVVCLTAPAALAQDAGSAPEVQSAEQQTVYETPAHIALVEGAAVLERDGRSESAPSSMPLLAGDRVRTQAGRVEVLFDDGSTLHLDHDTTVDFQSDEVVRLLSGRIRLNIPGSSRSVAYRVDAPGAWVQISYPGEYRIALLRDDEIELAVLRGAAELVNEDGRTPLRAGERAFARTGAAPSNAYVFNSAAWDGFDRWSESRRAERLGVSTQYLPDQVRPYASTFDRHGSWAYEPTYGYVWYPTVHVGWRPYYRGRWHSLRPYGWTWVGLDPWAWPTHHYGRWGFSSGVWFWIPGRHWGPAWVSWAYAPGYVSWCPLGWNNRPVVQFVNVNIYNGYRGRRHYDHWNAWTVVPRRHFGTSYVNLNVVRGAAIDGRVRDAFVVRSRAPEITGYAVPRASAPIRSAGTRVGTAVPRGTAPGSFGVVSGTTEAPRADRSGGPFRSERRGVETTGPGFPAPSSVPRRSATVPAPSRTGEDRGVASSVRERGVAPRPDSTPYDSGTSRRAVPRDSGVSATSPQNPRSAPERVPSYGAPSARPRATSPAERDVTTPAAPRQGSRPMRRATTPDVYAPRERAPYQPPTTYRVPERSVERERSPYQPPPAYRVPDRSPERYRETPSAPPAMSDRPRAMPRGGDAPSGYRAAPAPAPAPRIERSAPPPRQAAPSQAQPSGQSRGDGRRPRGN